MSRRTGVVRTATLLLACSALAACGDAQLLVLEPATLPDCDQPGIVQVSWQVDPARTEGVRLEITPLGRPSKLWVAGPAQGIETTGPWVQDGTTISLHTSEGTLLARQTVTAAGCRIAASAAQ